MDLAIIVGGSVLSLLVVATLFTTLAMLDDILRLTKLVETMKFEFIKLNEYWSDWAIDFKPLDSSELTKLNSFKNWNSFSFASHQLNFNSKKEALNTILDYRNEYKKNY